MDYKNIVVESVEGGVGIVTLNRPSVLNALSYELRCELDEALTSMELSPAIRAVVITGSGDKAFSAGADIHEMVDLTPEESALRDERKLGFAWHLANIKLPTIGAINGLAYGGAAMLASSLDIRIGCERTKFRFLAAKYGRINSTWTLPLIVGWPRAKELLYTARPVEAEEAARIGLLNNVVSSDQLLDAAVEMGRQIAKNPGDCVQRTKVLLNESLGRSWQEMQHAEENVLTTQLKRNPVELSFAEFLSRKDHK